jgi:hypothetical protein
MVDTTTSIAAHGRTFLQERETNTESEAMVLDYEDSEMLVQKHEWTRV